MLPLNDTRLTTTSKTDEDINKQKPLIFHLPDGDVVEVGTVESIFARMELNMTPILDHMDLMTNLLKRLDSRLRHWQYVYGKEGEWGVVDQDRTLSARDRHPFTHPLLKDGPPYSDTITSQGDLFDFWLSDNERVPLARKNWETGEGASRPLDNDISYDDNMF